MPGHFCGWFFIPVQMVYCSYFSLSLNHNYNRRIGRRLRSVRFFILSLLLFYGYALASCIIGTCVSLAVTADTAHCVRICRAGYNSRIRVGYSRRVCQMGPATASGLAEYSVFLRARGCFPGNLYTTADIRYT